MLEKLKQSFLKMWETPFSAAILTFMIYTIFSQVESPIWRETPVNYFSYLADAFLHGQLHLRLIPPSLHDLILYQDRLYLYWPPLPAVLIMPFVALFGVHISDVFYAIVIGTLNIAIVALVLQQANERKLVNLKPGLSARIILFFALGSVQLPLALIGGVWAVSELVAFFFLGLTYLAAISLSEWKAFLFTGFFLGCAFLTRNNTLLLGIWPAYYLISKNWRHSWKITVRYAIIGVLPTILLVVLFLVYNHLRFGNPIEIGFKYHMMADLFVNDYRQYGAFSLHYLPKNIYYQYIFYPFPWRENSFMGGSLFLMSPILFGVFCGIKNGQPRNSVLFLCLSILATNIPILLLMGTGWVQVGPRYTLDFTIPLILLLAMGIKDWKPSLVTILVVVSCLHYFIGAYIWLNS